MTLTLTADTTVHTDGTICANLPKVTSLSVTWKINPFTDPSNTIAYTGTLTDKGGTIQIIAAGTYYNAPSVKGVAERMFSAPPLV